MCGQIAFKLGIRIIQHMMHNWQKFLFSLLNNKFKIIANSIITLLVKVTKSRNGANFQRISHQSNPGTTTAAEYPPATCTKSPVSKSPDLNVVENLWDELN